MTFRFGSLIRDNRTVTEIMMEMAGCEGVRKIGSLAPDFEKAESEEANAGAKKKRSRKRSKKSAAAKSGETKEKIKEKLKESAARGWTY